MVRLSFGTYRWYRSSARRCTTPLFDAARVMIYLSTIEAAAWDWIDRRIFDLPSTQIHPRKNQTMAATKGYFYGLTWLCCLLIAPAVSENCERLKQSLTYTQEDAPRDLSGVVSRIRLDCFGFSLSGSSPWSSRESIAYWMVL